MDNEYTQNNESSAEEMSRPAEGESPVASGGESPEKSKNVGAVIGVVIIIAILVVGAFYFWGKKIDEAGNPETILSEPDTTTESLLNQSDSTEIPDIEADLNATDLDNLDAELQTIEQELSF